MLHGVDCLLAMSQMRARAWLRRPAAPPSQFPATARKPRAFHQSIAPNRKRRLSMRYPFILTLMLATATAVTLVPEFATAQQGQKPPPPAPVKPYKPLAATPPGPYTDPSFTA